MKNGRNLKKLKQRPQKKYIVLRNFLCNFYLFHRFVCFLPIMGTSISCRWWTSRPCRMSSNNCRLWLCEAVCMVGCGKRHKDSNTPFSLSILFFPIHIMQRYQGECFLSKLDIFMLARMEHGKSSDLRGIVSWSVWENKIDKQSGRFINVTIVIGLNTKTRLVGHVPFYWPSSLVCRQRLTKEAKVRHVWRDDKLCL